MKAIAVDRRTARCGAEHEHPAWPRLIRNKGFLKSSLNVRIQLFSNSLVGEKTSA
jgi:hypothetical protein